MYNFFLSLRSVLFYSVYTIFTLIFGFCLIFLQPILSDKARIAFLSHWGIIILYALRFLCGIQFNVIGKENIPKNKPFVVLSNHQSQWETYFLGYLFRPISIILKKELLTIPVFGWCISKMKPIAIDRSHPRQALKDIQNKGYSRIHDDRLPVLIFPEGTRQKPKLLGKFARSGAQLAIKANVDVIFVSHNSGQCWVPGKLIKKPGIITVTVSRCNSTEGKTASEITDKAKLWIETQLSNEINR